MNKNLLATSLLSVAILAGCNKDDNEIQFSSPDEAKQIISGFQSELNTDVTIMLQTDGMKAVSELSGRFTTLPTLENGRFKKEDATAASMEDRIAKSVDVFNKSFSPHKSLSQLKLSEDEAFNFEEKKGVYEYNAKTGRYIKVDDANNVIVHFPMEGSDENNAVLTIEKYVERMVAFTYGEELTPESIAMNFVVDGEDLIDVKYEATFNDNPIFPYQSLNYNVNIDGYEHYLKYNNASTIKFTLANGLNNKGKNIYANDYTISLVDEQSRMLEVIAGTTSILNMRIVSELKVMDMLTAQDDFGAHYSVKMYQGNKKLGKLIVDEAYIPLLEYTDGSTEKLDVVFGDTIDELEDFYIEMAN